MKTPEEIATRWMDEIRPMYSMNEDQLKWMIEVARDMQKYGYASGVAGLFMSYMYTSQKAQRWIATEEAMPPENEQVICYGTSEYGDQATFNVQAGSWWKCNGTIIWSTYDWDGIGGYQYFGKVTHWTPLPEPPKPE